MATENNKPKTENKTKNEGVSPQQIEAYRSQFLEPGEVGARKGIFVPRELVD